MVNLDFSNVPSRKALPEGIYQLQVAKLEETTSSTGNPMWKVEYDVLDVEGGRKLWENFVLIDKALWKLQEFLEAVGVDTSQVVDLDPQELVGMTVQAKVEQDTYQGETVNRVKKILASA